MALNYHDIMYFLEICETKNISRAAERIGVTQPSLSASVQRLEAEFGLSLLNRGRSGVELTKAGKNFQLQARQFAHEWEQLKSRVTKTQKEVTGVYSIGCHPSVALYTLPEFLPGLLAAHPRLELRLVHDLSRKVTEKVINFEVDFGIVVNPVRHPDLVITPLCRDQVGLWVALKPTELQRLNSPNCVLIGDFNLQQSEKLINSLRKDKLEFTRILPSQTLETVAELTHAGAGIGLLPGRVAARRGGLKPIEKERYQVEDRICLVYRPEQTQTVAAKFIIEAIKKAVY